jgi:DnaJ-class molecular chaperone
MTKPKKTVIRKPTMILVDPCRWCKGTGSRIGCWHAETCSMCKGSGGKWQKQMVVVSVSEETIS